MFVGEQNRPVNRSSSKLQPEFVSGHSGVGLAIPWCHTHITHMLNVISWLIGLVCLVLAIPLQLPILGIGLWLVLPVAVLGAGIGALSSSNGGRNLNLIVVLICALRLAITGGFF